MKTKLREKIEMTIALNRAEARWLKSIMQNPLYSQNLEDESETDNKMRSLFWDALDNQGIELI